MLYLSNLLLQAATLVSSTRVAPGLHPGTPTGVKVFFCCMQILPAGACFLAMVLGLFIIEVIGSPSRLSPFNLTSQELVIILAALGCGSCVLMTVFIPCMTRRVTSRKPTLKGLRRMNFLGLVRWLSDADMAVVADCDWLRHVHVPTVNLALVCSQAALRE